jgi:hypothetical protein
MKTTPRKTVNIVAQCESWLSAAKEGLDLLMNQVAAQKAELDEVKKAQKKRLKEIEGRKNALLQTISAVISAGGDASSLEKKKADIESELAAELANADARNKAETLELKLSDLNTKAASAKSLADEKAKMLEVARHLSSSFELDEHFGAKEAPEYGTLDEVIKDYAAHIRFDFCVAGNRIEQVAIWSAPNVKKPLVANIKAKDGVSYVTKVLPDQLSWLTRFDGYKDTPRTNEKSFKVGNASFVHSEISRSASTEKADVQSGTKPNWIPAFNRGSLESIYCSHNHRSGYLRSGLCFVRETNKFYALWPSIFHCAERKMKKETRRVGYYDSEVDVEYAEHAPYDASALLEGLSDHVSPTITAAFDEAGGLLSAKSPLSIRIRDSITEVADTNEFFPERNLRLNSQEIHAEIGAYWDAFVNAPWEPSIHGACGMLKHLCERRLETPHVYSYPVKGHYGLRVRTRDHDWIYAELFCPPAALSPKDPVPPSAVIYLTNGDGRCETRVMVGPCCMHIYTVR